MVVLRAFVRVVHVIVVVIILYLGFCSMLGTVAAGVLLGLLWWCKQCFGIGGDGGIVVVLRVIVAVRVVVLSSNLFKGPLKGECCLGLLTGIFLTRVIFTRPGSAVKSYWKRRKHRLLNCLLLITSGWGGSPLSHHLHHHHYRYNHNNYHHQNLIRYHLHHTAYTELWHLWWWLC